jgi:hypothetical protein
MMVVLGLGSIGLGIGASAAVLGYTEDDPFAYLVATPGLVALIWIITGVINAARSGEILTLLKKT